MKPRLLVAVAVLAAGVSSAQVTLDAPRGGWKHTGGEAIQHLQEVHYPASRVNAGGPRFGDDGRDLSAAIRGRIAGTTAAKAKRPQLLVVNGVAMPLSIDTGGAFARPYAFPPGSNSVEVRSADRQHLRRISFHDANATRSRGGLRIVLSWDSDLTDIDLHVVSPDGQHVFYGDRVAKNGGALDVDVTTGYGPEIYAIPSPPRGTWQIYVNYFGGFGSGDESERPITLAQVAIITREGTPDEKLQVFRIPLRRPGELTLVRSFVVP